MRARGLAQSHHCIVTDRQCPDLMLAELVRLPLAPAISAQGDQGPVATLLFLLVGSSLAISFSLLFLCFFFVGFSVLRMRPCMKAEEGFKAPKHLFLYVFLKHLPLLLSEPKRLRI